MAQPQVKTTAGRAVATFGGVALPNGQGTQSSINLNDGTNTFLGDWQSDDANRQPQSAQLAFLAKGVWVSDDFGPRKITLPMYYTEDGSHFLGQFLAQLSQAGEQQLSFDGSTYILAKYQGISGRTAYRQRDPMTWKFSLQLIAKTPWFQDAAATSGSLNISVDAGQNFNITYAGSVFAEPVWTLTIPIGNAVPINSMQIKNTMSGEFLTVNFLSVAAIPASTARTVTIDSGAMTAVDNIGNNYDISGSFPMVYPPVGTVNTNTVIITPASGSSSGLNLAFSYFPRWQI